MLDNVGHPAWPRELLLVEEFSLDVHALDAIPLGGETSKEAMGPPDSRNDSGFVGGECRSHKVTLSRLEERLEAQK
jgi:hypothetical protein